MSTSVFFIPMPKPHHVLLAPLLLWLAFSQWNQKPVLVRRLFIVSAIVNLPLFILFCYRDEFRNLALMFPFCYLAACPTFVSFYGTGGSGEASLEG